ncbi:MAG: hypothetical protein JSS63_13845 [Bacteroidetes bacterium]|nr:hypothetical protein [Bacteroidota bacterium]
MSIIKLEWKYACNLNDYKKIDSNENVIYLHFLRGRIIYFGKGKLKSAQSRHYYNMKKKRATIFNLNEAKEDLYFYFCKDNYRYFYAVRNGGKNNIIYDTENIPELLSGEKADEIIKINLDETSVYYATENEKKSLIAEANLQLHFIKKYRMDLYHNKKGFINGYCTVFRNQINPEYEIENLTHKVPELKELPETVKMSNEEYAKVIKMPFEEIESFYRNKN